MPGVASAELKNRRSPDGAQPDVLAAEADKNQALDKCAGSGFCGTINRRAYGKTEVIVCV